MPRDLLFGTARFLWRRALRHREVWGATLGCTVAVLSGALHGHTQSFSFVVPTLIACPLFTAFLTGRHILFWGALANSLCIASGFATLWLHEWLRRRINPAPSNFDFSEDWLALLVYLAVAEFLAVAMTLPIVLNHMDSNHYDLDS